MALLEILHFEQKLPKVFQAELCDLMLVEQLHKSDLDEADHYHYKFD